MAQLFFFYMLLVCQLHRWFIQGNLCFQKTLRPIVGVVPA